MSGQAKAELPPCPGCRCCTARLCASAARHGVSCASLSERGWDVMDLTGCPCAEAGAR